MTELLEPKGSQLARRGMSRRSVVKTAAWSAPAISVITAAPAFANSGDPVLLATWNSDSFRGGSGPDMTAGTPSNGTTAVAVRVDLNVVNGPISNLTATLTNRAAAPNGFRIPNNGFVANRGNSTWKANQGSLIDDGWTVAPTPSEAQITSFVFTQTSESFETGMIRFIISGFSASGSNSDFPAVLSFSSPDLAGESLVTITSSSTESPYIFGS